MSPEDRKALDALAVKLRRAADACDLDGVRELRTLDARMIALAALNDIDRERSYGKPGAGIDELLAIKEESRG